MHEFAALVLLDIEHGELRLQRADHTVVGRLAAHLGVERRLIEHEDRVRAFRHGVAQLVLGHDGHDLALVHEPVIAGELACRDLLAELNAGPAEIAEGLSGFACTGLLLLHQLAERLVVDAHALLRDHFVRQVDREAIGVVQLERIRAGEDRLALGLVPGQHIGKDLHAAVDGLGEVLLLRAHHAGDIALLLAQLWILALILMDDRVDHLIEERLVHAKQLAVPRSSAQQTAQDIAAPFVRR